MKKLRPTHINVILRPKAGDIAIEGTYNADGTPSSDGKFSVDDAKGIYAYMVKKGKELNKTLHTWSPKDNAGKNPKGGLNAKGRASYNAANPGKPGLKAPQPEGGSRKKSFCARMTGMKKKLTSAKTANDPNSRINKSLRAWKC